MKERCGMLERGNTWGSKIINTDGLVISIWDYIFRSDGEYSTIIKHGELLINVQGRI